MIRNSSLPAVVALLSTLGIFAVTISGCASAPPTKKEYRKVLILGFADGEIRPDEVSPILTNLEKHINEQKDESVSFRWVQKVLRETEWNSEVVRKYATDNHFDDVFIVSLALHFQVYDGGQGGTIGRTAVAGNASIKTEYLNVQTGDSDIISEDQKKDDSIWGGDVGKSRTREPLLDKLTDLAKQGDFPRLRQQPRLTTVANRSLAAKTRLALGSIQMTSVNDTLKLVIPGFLTDALSRSSKFMVVARSSELETVLKEQATGLSEAFDRETAAQVGKLSGASVLLNTEVVCRGNQCVINSVLYDLSTGETLQTANRDSDDQLASIKEAINEVVATLEGSKI